METLKKGNVLVAHCTTELPISGNEIKAAFRDSKSNKYPMLVTETGESSFDITIDTTELPIGTISFDIKIGTVSSNTIQFKIDEAIA